MEIFTYRTLVEIILLIIVVSGTYWKVNGFRKDNPSNPGDNRTQMIKDVTENKTRVEILEKGQVVLFEKVGKIDDKLEKIADGVSFIRGKMEG